MQDTFVSLELQGKRVCSWSCTFAQQFGHFQGLSLQCFLITILISSLILSFHHQLLDRVLTLGGLVNTSKIFEIPRKASCKALLMITYRPDIDVMVEARDRDAISEALHHTPPCVLLKQVLYPVTECAHQEGDQWI